MLVSPVYKVTQRLLSVPAVLSRKQASMDAELLVLRHENAVLRRQLAGPVRYEWADRLWFVALSSLAPWQHWAHVLLRGSDIHRSTRLLRWAFPVDGEAVGVAWCGVVLVEQSAE